MKQNQDHNEVDFSEEVDIQDASDWVQWNANIYDNVQQVVVNCTEKTAINACYNLNFTKLIKTCLVPYLVTYLVLWSGVMQARFHVNTEIVTSTSVEAEFAELKSCK